MTYDLHSHTTCSDGLLSAAELVGLAAANSVRVLSITDHDTIAAYQSGSLEARGIQLVGGIEFSTQWSGVGVHVVGLNINLSGGSIAEGVELQKTARRSRAEKIAERLEKAGLKDALAGASHMAGGAEISRPHFARFMVESGFCKSPEQAFKKYLGAGKPGDIKQLWAGLDQVISWIREAGGIAVLAHPHKYKLTRTRLLGLVDAFIASGGEGMEVLSGSQPKNITEQLRDISMQRKLLASMGSDFHGASVPWNRPGMHTRLPTGCTPVWDRF